MITLAGLSCEAPAASLARSAWVRKNGDFRFRSSTLSQPLSGKSSNSAPQAAPALLTRMSSDGSASPIRRRQRVAALHRGDVLRQRQAGPAVLRQLLGGRVAVGGLARGDVDLGAALDEAARDHLADAARAAGDQRRASFQREDIVVMAAASLPDFVAAQQWSGRGARSSRAQTSGAPQRRSRMRSGEAAGSASVSTGT